MIESTLELLDRINELYEYARRGDEFLPDEICNFLTKQFDLNAVVLFNLNEVSSFEVIGKSHNVKGAHLKGSLFKCETCSLIIPQSKPSLNFDTKCTIQISENMLFEACLLLDLSANSKMMVKIAWKSATSQNEIDTIEKILRLISSVLIIWKERQNGSRNHHDSLSKIVAETSNELKSGSNSIIGFTSILANQNLTSSQIEYISSIKKNAQNVLLNINDLSELSKIELKSITKNLKKVELRSYINEIINIFQSRIGDRDIKFVVSLDNKLGNPISLDDQKLRYVISTLLFVSTTLTLHGEIVINVSVTSDGKIQFLIYDSGKAFSSEVIENIFEPFVLSKVEDFKNSSITGLSFTLVKKYIEYLGGEISASSTAGKGNSFTFTISGEMMSNLENSIAQLPKPTSKNRVLVIEDDYATSKLLNNYLTKWGYDPIIVSTEEQAFNLINNEQLLAIILDIELPNLNGLELLKKIHEHHNVKNTPVIVCSVEPEQQKAFMMGAVEYFIKPINYNYLVEVLTNYRLRKNSKILCVDDDLPTLNLVKQAIESVGFIAVAENISANVMDSIKDQDIDLAIVDLDMPYPNGFELIKMIKSEKKFANLPIIIYTGKENYKEDLFKIEGLFEELLDKRSTNIEDLADTISAMINRYETPPPQEEVMAKDNVIKILLAEDYKHSQIIVTRLLKKNSFENIVVVENGEDAVRMAREEKFDLILMDMQMPVMNGFEATEKIRELLEYRDVPIIALTAFAMKGDREKCLEVGATDYIPKPIDSKEFIEKVKYYTQTLA
ncbi:MAG: response regulator [Ignavibacteriales bacterium]|nr:response regulator [Ignavibacteriales bacterium]